MTDNIRIDSLRGKSLSPLETLTNLNKIQKILGCTLKTRIYISGPITGLSIDEAYNNFERAERRLKKSFCDIKR